MTRTAVFLSAAVFALISASAYADLSGCGSKIRTVENLLTRLNAETDGSARAVLVNRPFRRIDVAEADRQHSEARAYLREGREYECRFYVTAALRALGYLL